MNAVKIKIDFGNGRFTSVNVGRMTLNDSSKDPDGTAENGYADKLELVFRAYEKSLDLDVALTIVPLNDDERTRLKADPDLTARIAVCDAKLREDMVMDLRDLSKNASSDGVRLQALKDLGRTFYPQRFKEAPLEGNINLTGRVVIVDDA